jgi:rhamnulokinase
MSNRVAAVDLGATSVRVAVVDLDDDAPTLEIVHRWRHAPEERSDGSMRWRWRELVDNVTEGLDRALSGGPLASIGIDGWAVDYGLLGHDGRLLSDPHSYRSGRTDGWRDIANDLGTESLYRRTGIQLMPINTIFQLAAHDPEELQRSERLLMLPELVAYELTGSAASELTNAGTTGLLDARTHTWAEDLVEAVGVNPEILLHPEPPGRRLGEYRGVPVHLVAAHDTACAFAASPLSGTGRVFLSAGTWFLIGVERLHADTSEESRVANFSNELAAFGGYRYLKNVPGFWMLEQCAAGWGVGVHELFEEAADIATAPLFDVHEDRFLAPVRMDEEVRAAAGLAPDASRALVARSIVESIAAAVGRVVDDLRRIAPVDELVVVGGGAAAPLLRDVLAEHTQTSIRVGATEATALGNALIQGIALGRFSGLDEARRWGVGA